MESPADALLAAREGAPTIMLDNFTPAQARRAVSLLERHGLRDGVTLEASGGITARNAAAYGRSGVDCVSVGAITSSARGIDVSLEVGDAGQSPAVPDTALTGRMSPCCRSPGLRRLPRRGRGPRG